MIFAFAGYLVLVSVLFAAAAWTTEQALSARRWPRRFVWILTLAASVAFPIGATLTARPTAGPVFASRPAELGPGLHRSSDAMPVQRSAARRLRQGPATRAFASPPKAGTVPAHPSLDELVGFLWLSSCVVTLFWYAIVWIRVAVLVRGAPSGNIESTDVRMTQAVGPAVFGLFRPAILWPAWLEQAPAAVRTAVIAHEREHVAAHDPVLLGVGLLLVALAPWNPVLWWQLQRMRFAIEADCDQRVLHAAGDPQTYAQVLLRIAEQRASTPSRLAILMSAPSWLERRIRILLRPPGRLRIVAAACVPFTLAALLAAAQIPAPSLRSPELRKLPGEDMRPGADWARGIAESRYPELFDRHFDGTAVVAAIFDRYGTLKLAHEHLFAPGTTPSDFDMALEDRELGLNSTPGVDSSEDILYSGGEHGTWTIGPWRETKNPGRVFIVYQVLKWPHDSSRSAARVSAALQAYASKWCPSAEANAPHGMVQVTVFMNDDGSVNRISKRTTTEITDDAVERFAAMGTAKERLGRRGFLGVGCLFVDYAWPRRPDDAPDVADLDTAWRAIDAQYPSREDSGGDARIVSRYFADIQAKGYQAIAEEVGGQRAFKIPWILSGRDGRIWDTGVFHSELPGLSVGRIDKIVEARYPGIRIDGWYSGIWRVNRVPIQELWIASDSQIQKKSDVDLRKRKDVLVTGAVLFKAETPPPPNSSFRGVYPLYFATAVDFDLPTRVFPARPLPQLFQVTVTRLDQQRVKVLVHAPETLSVSEGDPANWTKTMQLEMPYGQAAITEFNDGAKLVLRTERLRQ